MDTGRLIQRLWEASDTSRVEGDEQWTPHEFSPAAGSPRTFRWSVVILVLLLMAGAVALLLAATKIPESQAEAVATRYRAALLGLEELVPTAGEAARTVTAPSSTPAQLSEGLVPLARLEARALEVVSVATQQLPNPPPLALNRPIEALVPVRQELMRTAEQAQVLADRLTSVLDYRLLMARAFRLPPLPLSASSEEASELGVDLAVALADTIDILSQLPADPFFEGHRRDADRAVQELEELQATYLDALRQGDVDRTTELAGQIDRVITDVQDLSAPLAQADAWAAEALGELERLLAQAATLLGEASD